MLVIKNANIVYLSSVVHANMVIDEDTGKIKAIKKVLNKEEESHQTIDAKNGFILPGLIDIHTHLRDLQQSYKEDYHSGTMAAAHGGFTTVIDMPNKKPEILSVKELRLLNAIIKEKANIDVIPALMVKKCLESQKSTISRYYYPYYKLYLSGTTATTGETLDFALNWLKNNRFRVVMSHCEDEQFFVTNEDCQSTPHAHNICRPPQAEENSVKNFVESLVYNSFLDVGKIHISHLTLPTLVDYLHEKIKHGYPLSFEVTPHHLFLNTSDHDHLGSFAVVNPPIRPKEVQKQLLVKLLEEKIPIIASDHAPHTEEEKRSKNAPSGIPGLETTLPLLADLVFKKKITLNYLIRLCYLNPIKLLGLSPYWPFHAGTLANLVILDLKSEWKISGETFLSKAKWTPFEGWSVHGRVLVTLYRGNLVYSCDDVSK